jgi:hypothetical protein
MKSEMEKLREKQQRKRRRRTIRVIALSPLVAIAFVCLLNLLLRVNTIVIRNNTVYPAGEIYTNLNFDIGNGLLSFDRDLLSDELPRNCPYVKSVSVKYKLPNTVEVTVEPAVATVAVRANGNYLLLDSDFKVLSVSAEPPTGGILLVEGMDVVDYTVGYRLDADENIETDTIRQLIGILTEKGLYEHVSLLDLSKKYNISMTMYGVITVLLGNSEDLDRKVDMLIKILNENDVTVPAQIRVRNYSEGRYSRVSTDEEAVPSEESSRSSSSSHDKITNNS